MSRRRIVTAVLGGWLVFAPFLARPAFGQSEPAAASGQAVEYEKRLAEIRGDIERLRAKLGDEEKRERTVLSQLDRIAVRKRLLRSEWKLLQVQLARTRADRDAVGRSIPEMRNALAADRDRLARVLLTIYKHGRFSVARYALEARDLRTFVDQIRALEAVAGAQDRVIADFLSRLAALGQADRELGEKEAEIAALTKQSTAKQVELEAEEKKNRTLVAQIKTNQKTYEQAIGELNQRARELEKLLRDLESRPHPGVFPGLPFGETKGRLDWPVDGRVTQNYGLQKGSFNTKTENNGIEITPSPGDLTIRAIHAGKVVYADFFPSYGNLLILEHGGGYHSLYGHCAEFLVRNGDFVGPGTPLAVAGDTASLSGISLYFEIRYQTKPVNPLLWLRRR
ncbi:MAG TPA: peptidoglycan DD-metalloendopeptidase family protein [Candidatus Aminicenantes bacterium]|nr:peptidoglycan DD-metalloendopeptidase family protein [Acidobacteriota bacterium]HOF83382.1 peptidoglycan DD-metalloendopeptidase family protein [Candidatus Aminicenantes bacterium]MDD8011446.1 peptidoglycan DD-metalloendopeptidase family protein [Acidobacteriota bacterium]MDW3227294.1 peptidoglycan DD-metalloendopeptidase family protein [Acidobacteriota bacterium]HOS11714.1 peptidoglycan DD-metalloendopeptidase family protein [Candidatus Aminicenantes bacterium]